MGLGARMNLIIYLQLWNESMPLTCLSSSKIRREIYGFSKNLFGNLFLVLR
jgi:hypothetical protein